jgi:hypothetical protein
VGALAGASLKVKLRVAWVPALRLAALALIATVGAEQSFWAPFVLFLVASGCVAAMRVGHPFRHDAPRERYIQALKGLGWRG